MAKFPFHIQRIFIQNIIAILEDTSLKPPGFQTTEIYTITMKAIEDQTKISWLRFILGKISPLWYHTIYRCIQERQFERKSCTHQLIIANLEFALSLWKRRCSLMKEQSNITPQHRLSIQQCINLATYLCASPEVIPARDRHLIPNNPVCYFQHQSHCFFHTWYQYLRLLEAEFKKYTYE